MSELEPKNPLPCVSATGTMPIETPTPTGWICPVCGRGVSPWMSYCPCRNSWLPNHPNYWDDLPPYTPEELRKTTIVCEGDTAHGS